MSSILRYIFFCFFVSLSFGSEGVSLEIKEASKKAIQEKKLILLTIESENCGYCIRMEKDVFEVQRVMKKIEKKYVHVKISEGIEPIPSFLKLQYFPTNFIINPKNYKVIDEFPGYIKAKEFIELLEEVYKQEFNL